jgi:transposase
MTATRKQHSTKRTQASAQPKAVGVLYLAFELGWNEWKLAFATGAADNPRLRSIGGRNTKALLQEIAKAKERFGLPDNAPVHSCYEAGRDGFWLHRFL